jgi:hypothetical protein
LVFWRAHVLGAARVSFHLCLTSEAQVTEDLFRHGYSERVPMTPEQFGESHFADLRGSDALNPLLDAARVGKPNARAYALGAPGDVGERISGAQVRRFNGAVLRNPPTKNSNPPAADGMMFGVVWAACKCCFSEPVCLAPDAPELHSP